MSDKDIYLELVKAFDEKVDECMDIYLEYADSVDDNIAYLSEKVLKQGNLNMNDSEYCKILNKDCEICTEKLFELSNKYKALKLEYYDEESVIQAQEYIEGICQARAYLHLYPYRLMLDKNDEDFEDMLSEYTTRLVSEMQMIMYRNFRDEVWQKYLELGGNKNDYVF